VLRRHKRRENTREDNYLKLYGIGIKPAGVGSNQQALDQTSKRWIKPAGVGSNQQELDPA
jgi:hypothetical protein